MADMLALRAGPKAESPYHAREEGRLDLVLQGAAEDEEAIKHGIHCHGIIRRVLRRPYSQSPAHIRAPGVVQVVNHGQLAPSVRTRRSIAMPHIPADTPPP